MNKDEIKKALTCCKGQCCSYCPHWCEKGCQYRTLSDALDLITEQEKEIDRLKAKDEETCLKCIESKHATAEEYAKLQEEFANYQLASDKEIRAQVKQAQIDVLNNLKDSYGLYYLSVLGVKQRMLADILNPMIEELKK